MNAIEKDIRQFDLRIEKAHKEIGDTIAIISKTDENIKNLLYDFKNKINSISINGNNIFEKELNKMLDIYKNNCSHWCIAIEDFMRGKDFVNQFEKSVLVVVFGNVNVGKSSVGNFIAGTIDEKTEENKELYEKDLKILKKYFGDIPDFYEYDIVGNNGKQKPLKRAKSLFREGYVETTANIQYFTRKSGLTWTDSPGICSVNKENGDLAKKYVEFADLVIFITTSSSPAKNDEVQELKKLFGKKKPVLILINKSDKYEKDELDGKLVKILKPKSDFDRKKQEGYIKELFQREAKDFISDIDAISISRSLAMEALREEDEMKFKQSGFPLFFNKIGKIFEKNAVELKMTAPKQRMNAMIIEIIEGGDCGARQVYGVRQYKDGIKRIIEEINKTKKRLDSKMNEVMPRIVSEILNEVISLIQDESNNVRNGAVGSDLSKKINDIITIKTSNILQEELIEILIDYDNNMFHQKEYKNMKDISVSASVETVKKTVYDIKTVNRDPSGMIEHIEHFFLKKEFTRDEIRKRTITESFVNGDDSTSVMANVSELIKNSVYDYVKEFICLVKEGYFTKEEQVIHEISKMLDKLELNLKKEIV